MPDGATPTIGASERFFERLPAHIHAGLTAEQRAAIAAALRQRQGAPPPVNLRFSLPFPPGRIYLNVVAGRDRRGRARRRAERRSNPLRTMGNFLFVMVAAVVFYAAAAALLLSMSVVPA